MIAVLDIDGTLANYHHRKYLIDKHFLTKKDWDKFFDPLLVYKDKPIVNTQTIIKKFMSSFDDVVFLTGRPERLRDVTLMWLAEHYDVMPGHTHLMMRPANLNNTENMLERAKFKSLVFEKRILLRYLNETFLFVDDDLQILQHLAKYGICLKAPECWRLMFV